MRKDRMVRAAGAIGPGEDDYIIQGVAVVFGRETVLWEDEGYSVTEEIAPEACDNALARPDDVRCLINHDSNLICGRNTAGTLELWKELDGLHFKCQLDPEVSWQVDYWRSIKRGDLNQCSFAFTIDAEERIKNETNTHYIIKYLHLYDVSVVAYPAYVDTSAGARSADADRGQRDDSDEAVEKKDVVNVLDLLQTEVDFL